MNVLVVRDAFGDYAAGAILSDPAEIKAVEDAGQRHFCTPAIINDAFFAAPAKPSKKSAA